MARAYTFQSSFNAGVFSPDLIGRVDIEQYYRAAQQIDNGVVLPQGGVTKRNGFEQIDRLDSRVTGTNSSGDVYKLIPFEVTDSLQYVVVIDMQGGFHVYNEQGAFITSGTHECAVGTDILDIQYTQTNSSELVLVHPKHPPITITNPSLDTFESAVIDLESEGEEIGSVTRPPEAVQRIVFRDFEEGERFTLQIPDEDIPDLAELVYTLPRVNLSSTTQNGDTIGDDATTLITRLTSVLGFRGVFAPVYRTKSLTARVTRANGTTESVTVTDRTLDYITYTLASVLSFLGEETTISVRHKSGRDSRLLVTYEGLQRSPTEGDDAAFTVEGIWSAGKGYPTTVTSHAGRLVFGGSLTQPQTVWFSTLTDRFDFTLGTSVTSAIQVTLASDELEAITGMISGRRLLVMTVGRIHSIQSGNTNEAITGANITSAVVGYTGSLLERPINMDDKVFYLQSSGASLNSTRYEFNQDDYQTTQAALFSAHLLTDPIAMCKIIGSNRFNTNYLAVLNRDGTVAYYNSLEEQAIRNWTRFTTQGHIIDICSLDEKLYGVVRRGTSGNERIYLEVITEDSPYVDSGVSFTYTTGVTSLEGFDHLVGELVEVLADGYPVEVTVGVGGIITLPFAATEITVGLPLRLDIKTMPLNVNFEGAPILNSRKRIVATKIQLSNSYNVEVRRLNTVRTIPNTGFGFDLNQPPQLVNGNFETRLNGLDDQAFITISSQAPLPTTVLSVELEINTTRG